MHPQISLHRSLVESATQSLVKSMIQHLDARWHGILHKYPLISKVRYPTLKLPKILKKIKSSKFKQTPFKMRPNRVISRAPNKFQIFTELKRLLNKELTNPKMEDGLKTNTIDSSKG
jgi:hypothetical protein